MSFSARPRAPQDRSARWEPTPASPSPGAAASFFVGFLRVARARGRAFVRASPGAPPSPHPQPTGPDLTVLVYELLDAHTDTVDLVADSALDDQWLAHLEYLQALQRHARGVLARVGGDPAS